MLRGGWVLLFVFSGLCAQADEALLLKPESIEISSSEQELARDDAYRISQSLLLHEVDVSEKAGVLDKEKATALRTRIQSLKPSDLELKKVSPFFTPEPQRIAEKNPALSLMPKGSEICDNCDVKVREAQMKLPVEGQSQQMLNLTESLNPKSPYKPAKGLIYFSWGYNRAAFGKSDIHFKDSDGSFDFTIHDAVAKDRPTALGPIYYQQVSIPQYNYRVGYWFDKKERFGIEASMDHMKYVMVNDQEASVSGHYKDRVFDPSQKTTVDFLKYEHTDGYNLALMSGMYQVKLLESKNGKRAIGWNNKVGVGVLIPRTDVRMKGLGDNPDEWTRLNNRFHLAGVGIGYETGVKARLGHLFTEWSLKGSYVNVYNSLVLEPGQKATQRIAAIEVLGTLGVQGSPTEIGNLFRGKKKKRPVQ